MGKEGGMNEGESGMEVKKERAQKKKKKKKKKEINGE